MIAQTHHNRRHEQLVERARSAIRDVFSDTFVPRQTAIYSLDELRGDIDMYTDALYEDEKREAENG